VSVHQKNEVCVGGWLVHSLIGARAMLMQLRRQQVRGGKSRQAALLHEIGVFVTNVEPGAIAHEPLPVASATTSAGPT
jgi:hypothetical protein